MNEVEYKSNRCDDSSDNTNVKNPNGSNSSPQGGHEATDHITDNHIISQG